MMTTALVFRKWATAHYVALGCFGYRMFGTMLDLPTPHPPPSPWYILDISTTPHNCWQNISNTNIYLKTCKCPNLVLEGHTDSPQLNNTPQLLAEYIQYKCTSTIVGRTCTCFDLVLEGHTDTPQLNNTQQFLAVHFPYYIYLCILYSLFSICVFVFSDMTPQNIIVDIPVLSYYPKDSMCLEIWKTHH